MTVGLQITDGTTTVDLNDGSYFEIIEIDLGVGEVSAQSLTGYVRLLIDGTKAQIQTEIAALQKLMQAAEATAGTGLGGALYSGLDQRVFLNYRTDNTESYYRTELIRLAFRLEPASIEALNFDCGLFEYTVDFERRNWWEGPEAQLELSNHLVTNTTDQAPIFNPNVTYTGTTIAFVAGTSSITDSNNGLANFLTGDTIYVRGAVNAANNGTFTVATGGVAGTIVCNLPGFADEGAGASVTIQGAYCNYVDITGTDVAGDLPASTRLELINHYTNGPQYIWIGHGYHTNQSSFQHIYQAEDATGASGTANGNASNGQYVAISVASGAETEILTWPITGPQVGNAAGRYYKAIVRFFDDDTGIDSGYFRFRLKLKSGTVTIWQSSQVKPDLTPVLNIHDLMVFQLPPALAGIGGTGPLSLVLTAYQESGSAASCDVDFLQITPVDGFNRFDLFGALPRNDLMYIDGINDYVFKETSAGTPTWNYLLLRTPYATMTGSYIMLQPGRDQRLYFLQHAAAAGVSYIIAQLGLYLYYRPRRLSI